MNVFGEFLFRPAGPTNFDAAECARTVSASSAAITDLADLRRVLPA